MNLEGIFLILPEVLTGSFPGSVVVDTTSRLVELEDEASGP